MEKMEKIKAHQEQYGAKRGASSKRGRGPAKQTFKRQAVHFIQILSYHFTGFIVNLD